MPEAERGEIAIFNPLPSALFHYERETREVVEALGYHVVILPAVSAESGGGTLRKAADLVRHIRSVRLAVRSVDTTILVLWPTLHWLEFLLWSRFTWRFQPRPRQRVLVVVHDPAPLRRQFGLHPGWATLIARLPFRRLPEPIALSSSANQMIARILGRPCLRATHPMLLGDQDNQRLGSSSHLRIGVFGQYKPARDLKVLKELPGCYDHDAARLVLVGRGWPIIAGWSHVDQFVSEEELRAQMLGVDVVLLPYDRYFQSGIAVRALEHGLPVVGHRTDFLEDLYGSDYPGYVEGDDVREWREAIARVIDHDIERRQERYRTKVLKSWAQVCQQAAGGVS